MTTRLEPFTPTAVLPGGKSPVTGNAYPSRRSTTEEQREEAVRYVREQMQERRIFTLEVEVRWTRTEPTVLTVRGHAEHVSGAIYAVVDGWSEADLAGRSIALTPAERHARLEAELADLEIPGQ